MRILILLWIISALANFFVGGLNHIFARILLAIIPIFHRLLSWHLYMFIANVYQNYLF